MSALRLVHDVLDAQLTDRHRDKVGRVDDITLELRDGRPPRVATILVGGAARSERIGRWKVWLSRVTRALFRMKREGVDRIPFRKMRCIAETIQLDVDARDLESQHVEDWLGEKLICRIPGATRSKE